MAASPVEVANHCDILITVLPNGPHVESVAQGDKGILSTDNQDLMWLEMSTIDPQVTTGLASKASECGIGLLDTAIGGLTIDAEQGKLLFMVGASPENFEKAESFLTHLGRCIHCGPTGSGVTMKLINNQLAGVNLVATIEALLMGRKAGLKFSDMQQVLSGTAANNAHLHRSVPQRIIKRNFEDGIYLQLSGDAASANLRALHEQKAAIETEIGSALEWREVPDKQEGFVMVRREEVDPSDRSAWSDQHEWLREKLLAFHKVFAGRIKDIAESGETSS